MSTSLQKQIYYSDKYMDDEYEYRHVMLPKEIAKLVPKSHLMSETEWRSIGVQQSHGWIHYMRHDPDGDAAIDHGVILRFQESEVKQELATERTHQQCIL